MGFYTLRIDRGMGEAIILRRFSVEIHGLPPSFLSIFLYMKYVYICFVMIKTYQYRLYPNKKLTKILNDQIELCRRLYNAGLTERKEAYRLSQTSLTYNLQQNELPAVKSDNPEYNDIHSQVLCDVLDRLDKAYKGFFNRVKSKDRKGKKAGFPRYKSRGKYNSITYPQLGFKLIHKNSSSKKGILQLSKIGYIKVIVSRDITGGEIKTCTVKRDKAGDWLATFTIEFPDVIPKIDKSENQPESITGVDVGINKLAVLSNGIEIDNPKLINRYEKGIKTLQKQNKIRKKLAKKHRKIANARKDNLHKASNEIVNSGDIIVLDDLNIKGMVQNHNLAKSISDGSWSKLIDMCTYKVANAGKYIEFVNPGGTSQICSSCGVVVKKDLSVRIHSHNNCGLIMDMDLNAALNIREKYIRDVWNSLIKENKKPAEISTTAYHKDMQVESMKQEAPML